MPRPKHVPKKAGRSALVGVAVAVVAIVALLCAWGWASGFGGAPEAEDASSAASSSVDAAEEAWPSSGLVAAKVGEVTIPEDEVTEEIMDLRESMGLESADAWNEFLDSMGYEPETLREQVLTRRVDEALIAEECEARGLGLSDAEFEAAFEEEKAGFASADAWNAYLENYGMDEAAFKERLRANLLSERLQGALVAQSRDGWDELDEAEREQAILGGAEVLNQWLAERREEGGVSVQAMPEDVPYGRAS